jgi:hypothetical protein
VATDVGIVSSTSQGAATDRVAAALNLALNRRAGRRLWSQPADRERVAAVLRGLPSHGWVCRRDRALLVLSQFAGVPYRLIARLTRADVAFIDETAIVSTPTGTATLHMDRDNLLCGPCGLARWVHALDLIVVHPHAAVVASILSRAAPLTADSPHLCRSAVAFTEAISTDLLFPPTDQWGCLGVPGDQEHRARELEHRARHLMERPVTTPRTGFNRRGRV